MEQVETGEDARRRVEALEQRLAAARKTIDVLSARLEDVDAGRGAALLTLTQNVSLEGLVAHKTAEIEKSRSELEAALHQLQNTQALLLQAQKLESIGHLAAGVAHEINTPAQYVTDNVTFLWRAFASVLAANRALMALVKRLADGSPVERAEAEAAMVTTQRAKLDYLAIQIPKAIEQSLDGLEKVGSIVRAMKEFSHPSGAEKVPVNLVDLVRTATTVSRNEWKYVADLEVTVDGDLEPVPCLRNEISQVILNLVVNAAHAIADKVGGSGERGRIDVVLRREAGGVAMEVRDTGTGIPEHARERVFDPFFTTKGVGRGTGQGLAIVWSAVVDKHAGRISFETEIGTGTSFKVWLPLDAAEGRTR